METLEMKDIKTTCLSVITTFSDESLNHFISHLDEIPCIMANSTESLFNKLLLLKNSEVFTAINCLFRNPIDSTAQIKILKFWDFLISTCSSPDELDILFTDNATNNLILYPFEFSSTEILQSYLTVLKGISLKAKNIDTKKLLTPDENECPLYSHALQYVSNSDSVVISAARLVVLNLCLIKYPPLQAFLTDKASHFPLEQLFDNIGPDEFEFLCDFLNVAPLKLREFILSWLQTTLLNCSQKELCQAVTYLADSGARSLVMEIVSLRLRTFSISSPLTLGLLLFCLEKKLLLLDSVVKWGLIPSLVPPTFTNIPKPCRVCGHFLEEIYDVLRNRMKLPSESFSTALRCLEKLHTEPPQQVIDINISIINDIKQINPNFLMEIFLGPIEPRRRSDIEYLIDNSENKIDTKKEKKLVILLAEIQSAICRWRKKRFVWFSFDDLPQSVDPNKIPHVYGTTDGKSVSLSMTEMKLADEHTFKMNSIYFLKKEGKVKKYIDIAVVQSIKRSKSGFSPKSMPSVEQYRLEFPSTNLCIAFETEIMNIQSHIITEMLDKLEH